MCWGITLSYFTDFELPHPSINHQSSLSWSYLKNLHACAQSCPSLCDPVDYSMLGSSVRGIFFQQESWSGLPFPPPRDLPYPGIKLSSPLSPGSGGLAAYLMANSLKGLADRPFTTVALENYCLWKPAVSVMLEPKRNWDILVNLYCFSTEFYYVQVSNGNPQLWVFYSYT